MHVQRVIYYVCAWNERKKTQDWKYKSCNFHIKQCLGVRRSGDIVFNGLVQAFCFTLLKISKFIQVKSKTSFVKKTWSFLTNKIRVQNIIVCNNEYNFFFLVFGCHILICCFCKQNRYLTTSPTISDSINWKIPWSSLQSRLVYDRVIRHIIWHERRNFT